MESSFNFIHLVFVGFVALFPPVNPIGTALIVDPVLHHLDPKARKSASRRIAFYSFTLCAVTTLIGSWIFKFFGISLPVVQVAGGILICKMGWQFLSSDESAKDKDSQSSASDKKKNIEDLLFYPLAFPMSTGAGTISVLLTLSAHAHSSNDLVNYSLNVGALILAVFLMCIAIYFCYAYTPALLKKLGTKGEQVLNRLSAFLVFCVGIQILVGGVTNLINNK